MNDLDGLLHRVSYKPGWTFKIGGPGRSCVCIFVHGPDSTATSRERVTQHMFGIPEIHLDDDRFDELRWWRWLVHCIHQVERHETWEFFKVDGHAPMFPGHQGDDPYTPGSRWGPLGL